MSSGTGSGLNSQLCRVCAHLPCASKKSLREPSHSTSEELKMREMTCYFDLYCTLHEPLLLLHHAVHQLQHLLRLLPAGERAAGAGAARPPSPSA